MQAHPYARVLLIISAILAFWCPGGMLWMAAAIVVSAYVLTGQAGRLLRYLAAISPFICVAAVLWTFVHLQFERPDVVGALGLVFSPESNFLSFIRLAIISGALGLAIGSVPDGQLYGVLIRMGVPYSGALVLASGYAMVHTMGNAFERSHVALRAQGIVAPTMRSRLLGLGRMLSLTWVLGLSTMLTRSENKWIANGFLARIRHSGLPPVAIRPRDTAVVTAAAVALVFVTIIRGGAGHALPL